MAKAVAFGSAGEVIEWGSVADWAGAVGTSASVFWGVYQVTADRRTRRLEQRNAIHEIAHASERVAIAWEKLAHLARAKPRQATNALIYRNRFMLEEVQETLSLLVQRQDLTDGTVRCAVGAKLLAGQIHRAIDEWEAGPKQPIELWNSDLRQRRDQAQATLRSARRLRHIYGIRRPRRPHPYTMLIPPPT